MSDRNLATQINSPGKLGLYIGIIKRVIKPRLRSFIFVFVLMISHATFNSIGIGMVLPVLTAILQDGHLETGFFTLNALLSQIDRNQAITLLTIVTIVLFLLRGFTAYGYVVQSRAFIENLRRDWISRIGSYYLFGPFARVSTKRKGELLNNWQTETTTSSRFFLNLFGCMSGFLQVFALLIIGFWVSWPIMLVILLLGIAIFFGLRDVTFGVSSRLGAKKLKLQQSLSAQMSEDLSNIRELKLLSAEQKRLDSLVDTAERLKTVLVRITVNAHMPSIIAEFLAVAALMVLVLITVVVLNQPGESVLPLLAFYLLVFYRITTAASQVMKAGMKSLNEFPAVVLVEKLSGAVDDERNESRHSVSHIPGDIRFENVKFAYGAGESALLGASFRIPKGQVTFLVGPSGAGKSSVLDVLTRLERHQTGNITTGSVDTSNLDLATWRGLFGYVSQDAALFSGTIRDNFLLAKPDATQKEIEAACRLANADLVIRDMNDGFDTLVGDQGATLSGGQRKRIAIARALLRDPAVLILDEATTSFEEQMEMEIISSLRKALPHLTIVQVTHRLQTASFADHVVVLDGGRVVAEGAWADIERNYSALFRKAEGRA